MRQTAAHQPPPVTAPPPRLGGRDIDEPHRVATPLELLFDLSFVVAIAQATSQLHHGLMEGRVAATVAGYLLAFTAVWWAWMNYTWYASAYDDDSVSFRLLSMVQMGGVVAFATGVSGLFEGQFTAGVMAYVVMRLALAAQWLRAARQDPARRRTCLRYAAGVVAVQVAWVVFLVGVRTGVLAGNHVYAALVLLWLGELAVPRWAEQAQTTPWHAHHIAERYGLLVIIVLGECVLGAANSIGNLWRSEGGSLELAAVATAATGLVFSLWWVYFLLPSGEALHHHRERAFGWGYGHFITFAAVAAVGAGLEMVADVLRTTPAGAGHAADGGHGATALQAITTVAVAQALYLVSIWLLHRYVSRSRARYVLLVPVMLLCTALGPLAVAAGVPLAWALLLLPLGPVVAIAYEEQGRRRYAEAFQVR